MDPSSGTGSSGGNSSGSGGSGGSNSGTGSGGSGGAGTAPKSPFEIAQQGGKHSGFLKNYLGRTADEIRKGISSIRKEIAEHHDRIANPENYIPNFRTLDPRHQQHLLNKKWPDDIARQQEQLNIPEGLLNQIGGN